MADIITQLKSDDVIHKIKEVLPDENKNIFLQSLYTLIGSQNTDIQKCTFESVLGSAMNTAILGLHPSPQFGHVYFIPYKKYEKIDKATKNIPVQSECQWQLGYKGLNLLLFRSGIIKSINAIELYEEEIIGFFPDRTKKYEIKGNFKLRADKTKKPYGIYVICEKFDGIKEDIFMTYEQIGLHAEKYSSAWKTRKNQYQDKNIWNTSYDMMAKKTVIKKLARQLLVQVDPFNNFMPSRAIETDQAIIRNSIDSSDYEEIEYIDNNPSEKKVDILSVTNEQESLYKETITSINKCKTFDELSDCTESINSYKDKYSQEEYQKIADELNTKKASFNS